jgi:Protein of unknown function, DUF488
MIKTASWFTSLPPDHVRIGISRSVPRRTAAGYRRYHHLNPGEWFKTVPLEEYLRRYQAEVLDRLEPLRVAAELHAMAEDAIPVLLCFERPETGDWCHRAFVASWLATGTGKPVLEVGFEHLPQDQHPLLPRRRGAAA